MNSYKQSAAYLRSARNPGFPLPYADRPHPHVARQAAAKLERLRKAAGEVN